VLLFFSGNTGADCSVSADICLPTLACIDGLCEAVPTSKPIACNSDAECAANPDYIPECECTEAGAHMCEPWAPIPCATELGAVTTCAIQNACETLNACASGACANTISCYFNCLLRSELPANCANIPCTGSSSTTHGSDASSVMISFTFIVMAVLLALL